MASNLDLLKRFFRHYLKGVDNGWESVPHFQVLHELTTVFAPRWTTASAHWPPPARPLSLYAHDGGALAVTPPAAPSNADTYQYPGPSPVAPSIDDAGPPVTNLSAGWSVPPASGVYLAPSSAS